MRVASLLVSLLIVSPSYSRTFNKSHPLRVAVIDTGLNLRMASKIPLCKTGHKDFTKTTIHDRHGHGTNVSGIIDQYVKNLIFKDYSDTKSIDKINTNYCQIILKFLDTERSNLRAADNMIKAIAWAVELKVDVINISGGGVDPVLVEQIFVKRALDNGIKVVVAAGNNRQDLGNGGKYFPALYDKRITVVGNLQRPNVYSPSSNYGTPVNAWEVGTDLLSYSLYDGRLATMSGTSQATAVKTGKIIRSMISPR